MGISDRIEAFIDELLKDETDGWLELRRNELASVFGCVPSQINYVISTRFGPEQGYIVESKRGGGGYLRIKKVNSADGPLMRVIKNVGDTLDERGARTKLQGLVSQGAIDKKTASVILNGVSDSALVLEQPTRDIIRARIFKNMLAAAD